MLTATAALAVLVGLVPQAGLDGVAHAAAHPAALAGGAKPVKSALTQQAALDAAESGGANVEITSMRDESSETYATPDGQLEAVQHLRPVRTRVGGVWKDIDNTLAKRADGSVAPNAAATGITFSGGGTGPMAQLEQAGRTLAYTWPTPLPVPELSGDTALYKNVLPTVPDVDLQLRSDTDGFSELLVVRTAAAAASPELAELKLGVDTQGLTVGTTADGGLQATDTAAGGLVFAAPKPVMWDSGTTSVATQSTKTGLAAAADSTLADDAAQGPTDASQIAPIGTAVSADGSQLTLTPDQSMLTDAKTNWPVYIDPKTYTPKAGDWTMVSRYWASSPQYRFNGDSDAGVGDCAWDYCAPYDLKRLFYKVSTSAFAGKTILSAQFIAHETHSASCDGRSVELWRAKAFDSSTTWNSSDDNWLEKLDSRDVAYGGGSGCPGADVEFNAINGVKYAAAHNSAYTYFGLRAGTETDKYGWKRFSDDAYLRVKYNKPPNQIPMSKLSMSPGGDCDGPSTQDWVRSRPSVTAVATDPDNEPVQVQFAVSWDTGDSKGFATRWTSSLTTAKASGSPFTITLPTTVPLNKSLAWYARAYDGAQYSPWSQTGAATACYFTIDTTIPAGPAIVSGDYPGVMTGDPTDAGYDGPGRYGSFTIGKSSTDVVKYCYGINSDPDCTKHTVTTTSGAAVNVSIAPTDSGLQFITASAFDSAGNVGKTEVSTYKFRVRSGQPSRAQWKLDEPDGATQAEGSAQERTATLEQGAQTGAAGTLDGALQLDGTDDYADTDISAVETGESFSVSAWVNLSKMPDTDAVSVAQLGNNRPGFDLYYSKTDNRWVFADYSADTTTATPTKAMAAQAGGATAGQWTHLVGVAALGDQVLRLYVNGVLVGTTPRTAYWNARRGLQIGASSYGGAGPSKFFPGLVDDVKLFDKPLSDGDVVNLFNKRSIGTGRPAVSHFRLDEPATADDGTATTEVNGPADVNPAVFSGGLKAGDAGVYGKALTLDGVNDYAATDGPHMETRRSVTYSAWAKLPSTLPTTNNMVVNQIGTNRGGPGLYFSPSVGWTFSQPTADTATATNNYIAQGAAAKATPGEWSYLVGVRDAVTDELRLYVNGKLVGAKANPDAWYAGGPVMIGALSQAGTVSQYFKGQIDDVQMYDRILTDAEIAKLYQVRPLVKGRWRLDASAGTPAVSADEATTAQHPLTLGTGAQIDASGSNNMVGTGGLLLDGTSNGYATTAAAPIDTSTSFTASAWVTTPGRPTKPVTVMSMGGTTANALSVRYVPDATDPANAGRWQVVMANADSATATTAIAEHTNFQNNMSWNHIALVYDALAGQVRLYVDGQLQQNLCADDDDNGEPDDPTCTEKVSWNSAVRPFAATKGLQLGRTMTGVSTWGEYFSGAIDDLWLFQGAASDTQIAELANGDELATTPGP
ncbi:LamG domain-containing protein [Streptomyces sp. NBC_01465]|uniref:LamG domain-containing protein n=1 Tax=Streptomyces sp. NBC_01465 TaxID=2903878 RepID=UPI002E3264C5|nr:LamG domain-containing protein [Streptomyces sp. NBC_01465]